MFSKTIPSSTITTTTLNRAAGYTADATLTITKLLSFGQQNNTQTSILYPRGIQLINKSGTGLEWLVLANDDEIAMYADPTNYPYFSFILLPNNGILGNSNLLQCKQFIIRSVGGAGATSGIRIDFYQYTP